jgi:DNA-binding LytR/AlgR family response regulator
MAGMEFRWTGMMKLNCLIVDDESAGREIIENYARGVDFIGTTTSAGSAIKAMEVLGSNPVDLLFLDVQMPRMSGLDFLRTVAEPPLTVLVTAHSEYALQGYDLNVIDYLLKPVSHERFVRACNKAREFYELKHPQDPSMRPDHFFIKCNNQYERVNYGDLLFIEAANNYVILQTKDKKLTSYLTFKAVSDYLGTDRFVKVHKSYMVSMDKIDSIDGEKVCIGSHEIPISRSMRNDVMEMVLHRNVIRR